MPSCAPPKTLALREDQTAKRELTNILAQCYDALKVYGKEPEQLNNLNKMFHFVLSDYPIDKIKEAFRYYLKNYTEMPAPADIARIIDRGGSKPPLDRTVYVTISKKRADERTSEEWAYMREYEAFQIRG